MVLTLVDIISLLFVNPLLLTATEVTPAGSVYVVPATTSSLLTPFHEKTYEGAAALTRELATAANMNKISFFIYR